MLARPIRGCATRLLRVKKPCFCVRHPTLVWPSRRLIFVKASAAGQSVMVVESPTKAIKIQKFLNDKIKVLPSYGHIRDLPSKTGSVKPEEDFAMLWDFMPKTYQRYKEIEDAVRQADRVLLATDPDREGEAISWHITQELQGRGLLKGCSVQRVTFTEITQLAVTRALQAPREVSVQLVDAYLARRALDYLVGFTISPLLWRKLHGATSAGRVQSVTLRLCCEREVEKSKFTPEEYWSITVHFLLPGNKTVTAMLSKADDKKMGSMAIKDRAQAESLAARIKAARFKVTDVQSKLQQRQPAAPFITSTLQQEASNRLGFGASRTMQTAQALYEGSETGEGLITYMRTDGVQLSPEATQAVRGAVSLHFSAKLVSEQPRVYKSRAKNAQEAHEAIRPTNPKLTPDKLPATVSHDQHKLYRLIWERTLASQMRNAVIEQIGVDFSSADGSLVLRATGSRVKEPGYLMAYDNFHKTEGEPDESSNNTPEDAQAEANNSPSAAALLSVLKKNQAVSMKDVVPDQHFTRPPPRYNDASLIKALEELGIGRPSTYAPTLKLLQSRGYINKEGRSLAPTSKGLVLTAFLQRYFGKYIDYNFTSQMEEQLDEVSVGSLPWKSVLHDFWGPFQRDCESLQDLKVSDVVDMLDEELQPVFFPKGQEDTRQCPMCSTGKLHFKPSKYGGFVGCSNFDDPQAPCSYARPLHVPGSAASSTALELAMISGPLHLGYHPTTHQPVLRKLGPYGPYLELGPLEPEVSGAGADEAGGAAADGGAEVQGKKKGRKKKAPKAKKVAAVRAPIPQGVDPESITLEQAIQILDATIPQSLGTHPEDGAPIFVKTGRYGPYVQHQTVLAPLPKDRSPESITLDEAVELIAKKVACIASKGSPSKVPKATTAKAETGKTTEASSKASKAAASARKSNGGSSKASKGGTAAAKMKSNKVDDSSSSSSRGRGRPQVVSKAKPASPTQDSTSKEAVPQHKAQSYLEFCSALRPKVKADNPEASPTQMMKILAQEWQKHKAAAGVGAT